MSNSQRLTSEPKNDKMLSKTNLHMKTKSHSPPAPSSKTNQNAQPRQQDDQQCLALAYSRLAKIGFTKKFIRNTILPSWVCEQAEKDPDLFPELALFLGKALGISSRSLADPRGPLVFRNPSPARYKPATGTILAEEKIIPAKTVNQQIALQVEACLPKDPALDASELDPIQIRNYILASSRILDFKSLLAYCWHLGIVVLPAVDLHSSSALKFTGMITWQKDRPFIFLRGNAKDAAWGLFVLAHELAHLALGHVKQGDAAFLEESCDLSSISDEEVAANEWALLLILGENKGAMSDFIGKTSRITAKQLASRAIKEESSIGVDAGFLVLKSAWERSSNAVDQATKDAAWPTARAALKDPSIRNEHTKPLMLDALRIRGDLSKLATDERELVIRALELDK
jgi:Zn-dependent peptidase ImmA (M78 family)